MSKFYICAGKESDCKHLIETLYGETQTLTCDGEPMKEVIANTVDAAKEKHVPEVTREGNHIKVQVGSVEHPMEEKHYITFIMVKQGNRTQRVDLKPGDKPVAEFDLEDGPATVYEYCNLHGLWSADC